MKIALLPFAVALLLTLSARGQDAETQPGQSNAVQTLTTKLKTVEAATEVDETSKAKAVDAYKQAIVSATSADSFRSQVESFKAKTNVIETTLAEAKAAAALPKPKPSIDADSLDLKELDKTVQQKTVDLESFKQAVTETSNAIAAREKRLLELPTAIAEANTRLSQIEAELNASPLNDEPKVVTEANSTLLDQRRAAVKSELDALKAENAWHVASGELLPLKRDNARRQLDAQQAELKLWQEAATRKRGTEVDRDILEAEASLDDLPAPLQPLGGLNLQSARDRRETETELKERANEQSELEATFNRLDQQFKRAQKEAQAQATITQSLGEVLRERRIELRAVKQTLANDSALQSQVSKKRLQLFLLREELAELENLQEATIIKLAELGTSEEFEAEVRKQLKFRTALLKGLTTDTEALFGTLAKLEGTTSGLRSLTNDYAQFIDERVLWIRSADPFGLPQIEQTVSSAMELAGSGWSKLPKKLLTRCFMKPILPTLALAAFVPVLIFSYRLRSGIRECGEKAKSGSCRDFSFTWRAALLTIALGLVWPATLYLVGVWLRGIYLGENELALRLSAGFVAAGAALLPLELWRQAARKLGLMESHFGIAPNVAAIIRRNLGWQTCVLVPLIAMAAMIRASGNPIYESSLGRVVFVVAMLVLANFLYRVANPKGGAPQGYLALRSESLFFKGRFVWFWLLVGVPIVFVIMALGGYQFTAEQLSIRLFWSCFLVLGIWFLHALALRWVVLSRRRLAIEQARVRLAKASEQAETDPVTAEAQANLEEIDLSSVDQQTRRLVRAITVVAGALAIWSLWVDVLPALSKIGDVKAWDVSVATVVADQSDAPDNVSQSAATTIVDTVTYGEVFKAVTIFCIMLLAMRDVPGLLELVLLQRLPLDVALRFAITTLTRYVIFVVGTAWVLGTIHVGWSKVQWLVAGISVGLGFGLQEIFANFVSGLIILFERPLRAGDIVTIDGVTGTVKSVRMRATIIQDLDRKDFIVPNKDFITGRLLNWTLSDEVSRIVVPVGIAYGSNTGKAKELMLAAATDHEQIVDEPPPQVTFEKFGDSSLNLVLRCFISLQNMPSRLKIVDELHSTIDGAFRDADIEIPFPQRDLHLRSSDIEAPVASITSGANRNKEASKTKDAR